MNNIYYFIDKFDRNEILTLDKKINIIYRNYEEKNIDNIIRELSYYCKFTRRKLFLSNNIKIALRYGLNGLYIPSFNKILNYENKNFKKNFKIIGSAHNIKEISMKMKQGCNFILFSKLFYVNYDYKAPYTEIIKFNNFLKINKNLIPLGGINTKNLNKLNIVNCRGFALLSEIKKKPVKILNRLF